MANSPTGESVIERVDRILAAFSPTQDRLTVGQIARSAGLPVSSAHRLCHELVQRGWLMREGVSLTVGTRLWELTTRSAPETSLSAIATPFMHDAHSVLGQHIQLGRVDGREVLFLQRLAAHGAREISSSVAGRLPLHVSAVGLVLLAWMPKLQIQRYLEELQADSAWLPQGDVSQLEAVLRSARSLGHVIQSGNVEPDRTGIAVPVRGSQGKVVAGLGVVLDQTTVTVDAEVTVQVLRAAAHGIERTLQTRHVR